MSSNSSANGRTSIYRKLIGNPKDFKDPNLFHKIALIPLLAWIGLGADGLSSSAYGPEEVFRVLGPHSYLAIILALSITLTVAIISYAYSRIIEYFPNGGGGYMVATQMLGEKAGVVSGSALIIDYILTITVSIVSATDAIFSYLPLTFKPYKIYISAILIVVLIFLNIRGVKESVTLLAPIFFTFLISHIFLIGYGVLSNSANFSQVANNFTTSLNSDYQNLGFYGLLFIIIKAYSLGGGTYTGIEAVSNGLQVMREPKVKNGKRTMLYLALSLSIAASGLMICYLLAEVNLVEGKTLNAVLADKLYSNWSYGWLIAVITIGSEGALLFVAAQAGFIDAPRVMANMALDNWLPRRFAILSDRLTMKNGIVIIGIASLVLLFYTNGSIGTLVLMYAINVFLTFTLSEFGMTAFFFKKRNIEKKWFRKSWIHIIGLILCSTVLVFTVYEKFLEGGWVTVLVTSSLILICFFIRNHYNNVSNKVKDLDKGLRNFDFDDNLAADEFEKDDKIAILLVDSYNGLGVNTLNNILTTYPQFYSNIIFVSVGLIDQNLFKGEQSIDLIEKRMAINLNKYAQLAKSKGLKVKTYSKIGVDIAETLEDIILEIKTNFQNITVYSGKLVFDKEEPYHRVLHNQTALNLQSRLQKHQIINVILPINLNIKGAF